MAIFCKLWSFFLAEIRQAIGFSMLEAKKLTKSWGIVAEVYHYETGAISLYFGSSL